ncbi:MAG: hypothetical protein ACKVVT_16060 [Dehalococcoidia bacterium]
MDERHLDELLETTLRDGREPEAASPSERLELGQAALGAQTIRSAAPAIEAEAEAALPVARARFERFVAANRPVPAARPVAKPSRRAWWMVGGGRPMAMVGSLAGVALLVAVIGALALSGGGAGTAAALEPGDYVQLEGVVSAATSDGGEQLVRVESDLGPVDVAVSALTAVGLPGGRIAPGTRVTIAGLVEAATKKEPRIAANAVSLANSDGATAAKPNLRELKKLKPGLRGVIVLFNLAPAGDSGWVVLRLANGDRVLVGVDAATRVQIAELDRVIGTSVEVVAGEGGRGFGLTIAGAPSAPKPGDGVAAEKLAGPIVRVLGIPTGMDGRILTLRTLQGTAEVVIKPATLIVVGQSGVPASAIRKGEFPSGITLGVAGRQDAEGRIVADRIIVERRPGAR